MINHDISVCIGVQLLKFNPKYIQVRDLDLINYFFNVFKKQREIYNKIFNNRI